MLIPREEQIGEASGREKSNPSGERNRFKSASGRGLAAPRSARGNQLTSIKSHHSPAKLVRLNSVTAPEAEMEQTEPTFSMARDVRQMSRSGVLDAILEVSKQRTSLLGQLRSALLSGNDSEALGFARRLCGLPA